MKPRKARDIQSVLERKGFVPMSNDHVFFHLHVGGKKTSVRTKLSHGIKEYGPELLGLVKEQLFLSSNEFENLLDCSLTGEGYVSLLIEKGVLKVSADSETSQNSDQNTSSIPLRHVKHDQTRFPSQKPDLPSSRAST